MTTLPIEATRTASKDRPVEEAMGEDHVWDQGFTSLLPSEQHAKKAELAKTPEAAKHLHEQYLKGLKDPSKSTKKPEDFLEKSDKGGEAKAPDLPKSLKDAAKPVSEKDANEWQEETKAILNSDEGKKAVDAAVSEPMSPDTFAALGALGGVGTVLAVVGFAPIALPIGFAAMFAGAAFGGAFGATREVNRKIREHESGEGSTKAAAASEKDREKVMKLLTAPTVKDVENAARFVDNKGKLDMTKLDKALKGGKTATRSDLLPSEQHASKTAAALAGPWYAMTYGRPTPEGGNTGVTRFFLGKNKGAATRWLRGISPPSDEKTQVSALFQPSAALNLAFASGPSLRGKRQDLKHLLLARSMFDNWEVALKDFQAQGRTTRSEDKEFLEDYAKNLRLASQQEAEKLEAEAEANEQQAQADRAKAEAAQMRQAAQASGLYGYTKGTQRDVEASVRKAQRRANSIAKVLYARDERSVVFLKAHAKRANSKSARLILAAMKNIGPRVASDKTAALLPSERHASIFHGSEKEQLEYVVDALRLAGKQGLRVDGLPRKGALAAQQKGFADAERGQLFITSKGKSVRLASERHAADRKWFVTKRGGSAYSGPAWKGDKPRWFDSEKEAKTWAKKLGGRNPAGFSVEQIPEGFTAGKYPRQMRGKTAGGLYGHPTKTARLALVACSDLRAYVGEVAFSLHSRRTAKYAKMTGFLKEHGKKSRCAYSRMILDCYPDAPVVKAASSKIPASEMLKKAFVPDSVDGWLEWADGTRTATTRRRG